MEAAAAQAAVPTPAAPPMMGGGAMPAPMMGGGYAPTPPPPMMSGGAMPQMANGGEMAAPKKNPFKDFFADINMIEAGILALGVATFLYAIYYYKFEMKMTKTGYAELNARVQKLEASEAKRSQKEASANAAGKLVKGARKRMLI